MSQLRRIERDLEALDIRVKLVTFDANYLARVYVRQTQITWPLLVDSDRALYRGYGMLHATWWQLYRPRSIWKYLVLAARGVMPGKPGEDWSQLGGDVLIDPVGMVRVHFVSADPHDRPPIRRILQEVEQARRA